MFGNKRWSVAALAGGLALATLTGCAGGPGVASNNAATLQSEPSEESPSESVAVPPGQPAKTLSPDALDAPAATSVADAQRSAEMAEEMSGGGGHGDHSGHGGHGDHSGHGSSTYLQTDAGREPAADHEFHFVCPMHPEVTSDSPGKCPKCGMDLVKRRKE